MLLYNFLFSDSVSKLVVLIKELFNMSIKTEDQVEAGHFFEAALFVVDTFLVSTPKVHQPALLAIPQSAGNYYLLYYSLKLMFQPSSTTTVITSSII